MLAPSSAKSSNRVTTNSVPVTKAALALKRAVDWKIFELQSILISEEVDEDSVNECVDWFQPRHLEEALEERVTDDRCGYPLCVESLNMNPNQKYRINYSGKQVFEVEHSNKFCSSSCLQHYGKLYSQLSIQPVYSRPAAQSIKVDRAQVARQEELLTKPNGIDDVLDLISASVTAGEEARQQQEEREEREEQRSIEAAAAALKIENLSLKTKNKRQQQQQLLDSTTNSSSNSNKNSTNTIMPPPPAYSSDRVSEISGKISIVSEDGGNNEDFEQKKRRAVGIIDGAGGDKGADIKATIEGEPPQPPIEHVPHRVKIAIKMQMEQDLKQTQKQQQEEQVKVVDVKDHLGKHHQNQQQSILHTPVMHGAPHPTSTAAAAAAQAAQQQQQQQQADDEEEEGEEEEHLRLNSFSTAAAKSNITGGDDGSSDDVISNANSSSSSSSSSSTRNSSKSSFSSEDRKKALAARRKLQSLEMSMSGGSVVGRSESQTGEADVSINDIFATMKQLQEKHAIQKKALQFTPTKATEARATSTAAANANASAGEEKVGAADSRSSGAAAVAMPSATSTATSNSLDKSADMLAGWPKNRVHFSTDEPGAVAAAAAVNLHDNSSSPAAKIKASVAADEPPLVSTSATHAAIKAKKVLSWNESVDKNGATVASAEGGGSSNRSPVGVLKKDAIPSNSTKTTNKLATSIANNATKKAGSMSMAPIKERTNAKVMPIGSLMSKKLHNNSDTAESIEGYAPRRTSTNTTVAALSATSTATTATVLPTTATTTVTKGRSSSGSSSNSGNNAASSSTGGKTPDAEVAAGTKTGTNFKPPVVVTPVLAARPLFNKGNENDLLVVDSTGKFIIEPDEEGEGESSDGGGGEHRDYSHDDDDDDVDDSLSDGDIDKPHTNSSWTDNTVVSAVEGDYSRTATAATSASKNIASEGGDKISKKERKKQKNSLAIVDKSLFMSVWEALDDLFGPEWNANEIITSSGGSGESCPASGSSTIIISSTNNNEQEEEEDGIDARAAIATSDMQKNEALQQFLNRGLANAESLFTVSRLFKKKNLLQQYNSCKNLILSFIKRYQAMNRSAHIPSVSSAGWNLIGLLIVDAAVRSNDELLSAGGYSSMFSSTAAAAAGESGEGSESGAGGESGGGLSHQENLAAWNSKVEAFSAAALGGGLAAASKLREGDLRMLRSFFDVTGGGGSSGGSGGGLQ